MDGITLVNNLHWDKTQQQQVPSPSFGESSIPKTSRLHYMIQTSY